jgi:hypothetical protein
VQLSAELLRHTVEKVADLQAAAVRETFPGPGPVGSVAARQRELLLSSLRHAGVLCERHMMWLVLSELVATKRRLMPSAGVAREHELMLVDRRQLSNRALDSWRQVQRQLAQALYDGNPRHCNREVLSQLLERQVDICVDLADSSFRSAVARGLPLGEAVRRIRDGAMARDPATQEFAVNVFALGLMPDPDHVVLQIAVPPPAEEYDKRAVESYRQLSHLLGTDVADHLAKSYAAAAAERSEM